MSLVGETLGAARAAQQSSRVLLRCSRDGGREAERPSGIPSGIPAKACTEIHLLWQILLIIYALLSSFQGARRGAHCRGQINNISDIRSDDDEGEADGLQAGRAAWNGSEWSPG